jgi:hypothetical protein
MQHEYDKGEMDFHPSWGLILLDLEDYLASDAFERVASAPQSPLRRSVARPQRRRSALDRHGTCLGASDASRSHPPSWCCSSPPLDCVLTQAHCAGTCTGNRPAAAVRMAPLVASGVAERATIEANPPLREQHRARDVSLIKTVIAAINGKASTKASVAITTLSKRRPASQDNRGAKSAVQVNGRR